MSDLPPHPDDRDPLSDASRSSHTLAQPPTAPMARPIHTARAAFERPDPMLLRESSTRWSALADVAIVALAMLLLEIVGTFVLSTASGIPLSVMDMMEAQQALLMPLLAMRFINSTICVLGILAIRRQSRASVGLVSSRLGMNFLIGIGATMAAYAIIMPVMIALTLALPETREQMNQNVDILTRILPRAHPLEFLGAMATVGIWEELFFRGFLMTRLRRVTGGWIGGVALSTAVFVALHALTQAPAAMVMITILSLIMSVVTIWRRSVIPAMVAHALFDISQLIGLYFIAGDQWQ